MWIHRKSFVVVTYWEKFRCYDNWLIKIALLMDWKDWILSKLKNIFRKKIKFVKGDIRDYKFIKDFFEAEYSKLRSFDCVFHLAGLKSIKESYQSPIEYWETNVLGTINLLKVMEKANCYKLIFSSSAGIYKYIDGKPISEESIINPCSPYANYMCGNLLNDIQVKNKFMENSKSKIL